MVIREKDYLKKTKKKYIKGSIIWFLIMISIFGIGYILNKTRNNVFTIVAAVLVLPVAQYLTKLIGVVKYKDPTVKESLKLESIKGEYNIFHSVIIPNKSSTMFLDHIIVTENKIFCFLSQEHNKEKKDFINKSKVKGIDSNQLEFFNIDNIENIGNIIRKVEKHTYNNKDDKRLSNNTRIIDQMMM